MLRYTLMRFGVFAGCFVVVWALVYSGVLPKGLGDSNYLWVIFLALVISAPLSFVLLRGVRDDASRKIVERVDRAKANLHASQEAEDAADDAARTGGGATGGPASSETRTA
ncbi:MULTISPECIES: DUF4229 domain-containing protein [Streptomyces]|uniref:DUF4229 domain-containing protein n=1 Tax=Streptomyces evansiae TaxID=3075535 RepID=A0ABU2R313_9ACTN|nr:MULTISPECIES: DUF4229 domain-containing protein [unclassified Streptomyces]ASY33401.1 hypothetical protein CAC01_12475 [Streptomyces sp. CLI2509]EFL01845.1 conserved hypothetical protein [Streptomyces sp. SPB78]MDT0409814.1 DUF4229 domain-containing protein [Streptomyces sp. DSM 41979]MDT0420434.1 DUF4229 domain-containing protein [Streptomyces sp. DSM 41859]MYQ60125.1 DUF4229 domain-containing protein [Streptomyces sp. SID4926]